MNAIKRWWCDEAEWWEFWKPLSGISGGAILGALISIVLLYVERY